MALLAQIVHLWTKNLELDGIERLARSVTQGPWDAPYKLPVSDYLSVGYCKN